MNTTSLQQEPRAPLTDIEAAIVALVGEGRSVKGVRAGLVERGYYMAEATVTSRIRGIMAKIPNPYDLPPMSAIKCWICARQSAA